MSKMTDLLLTLKNSIFGIVVIVWGAVMALSPSAAAQSTLVLLHVPFTEPVLGLIFIAIGLFHVISKCYQGRVMAAFANITIAAVFLLVSLTHLYYSVYAIAWIAFAGIVLNLVLNAISLIRGW